MAVSGWQAPDEPVPFAEAAVAAYRPIEIGTPWGPPWATTWFRIHGTVPPSWVDGGEPLPGTRIEAVVDLGFTDRWPGFQAEGLAYDVTGKARKGINPLNRHVRISTHPAGSRRRPVGRGRVQPHHRGRRRTAVLADTVGRQGNRR